VLDEGGVAGAGLVVGSRLGAEGLEVLADDGVEDGFLGLATTVAGEQRAGGGAGLALVDEGGQRRGHAAGRGDGFHGRPPLQGGCRPTGRG
jgi:hypothetical protein